MKPTIVLITFLFIIAPSTLSGATRPQPASRSSESNAKSAGKARGGGAGGAGFFGPGGDGGDGFNIPGYAVNWPGIGVFGGGYGGGYGGPAGWHSKDGTIKASVVCKEKGPCYMKKLTCPSKCFTSSSTSGKGYGGGGGGGACTMDCKKKCLAYC
ncbi:hypothetical protein Nepgr_017708 [Nepenthes gracilis]|uniref:Uncharacterized protein n=1 Tax=Nepenthes gracilis TaxID=150966 RepID=A0AAD3XSE4_NEPGR|nr:hypothetical protein Nepgr_017708 [Nepenthes gracilis]